MLSIRLVHSATALHTIRSPSKNKGLERATPTHLIKPATEACLNGFAIFSVSIDRAHHVFIRQAHSCVATGKNLKSKNKLDIKERKEIMNATVKGKYQDVIEGSLDKLFTDNSLKDPQTLLSLFLSFLLEFYAPSCPLHLLLT